MLFKLDGTKEKSVLGLDAFLKQDKQLMQALSNADEVYEPYGGSLVYLLNMTMLYGKDGRLLKPTHILMARSFDHNGKVDIVDAIRNADEATLQDIRARVVEGKKPKTNAALTVFDTLHKRHGKQLDTLWKQDFDRIAQVLRDPNLHLYHDGVDTDIFSEIIEKAQQGRKIFMLDDSDYADMPFEYGQSKYKGVGEQVRKNAIEFLRKYGSKHYLPESTWRDVNDQLTSTSNDTRFSKNINYLMMQKATVLAHILNADGAAVSTNNLTQELIDFYRALNEKVYGFGEFGNQVSLIHDGKGDPFIHKLTGGATGVLNLRGKPESLAVLVGNSQAKLTPEMIAARLEERTTHERAEQILSGLLGVEETSRIRDAARRVANAAGVADFGGVVLGGSSGVRRGREGVYGADRGRVGGVGEVSEDTGLGEGRILRQVGFTERHPERSKPKQPSTGPILFTGSTGAARPTVPGTAPDGGGDNRGVGARGGTEAQSAATQQYSDSVLTNHARNVRNSLAEITTSNNIEVVGRKTDLPEELRGGDDFTVKAVVDPKTGRIYVVADAVSQGELAGLAAHEVGVHQRRLALLLLELTKGFEPPTG